MRVFCIGLILIFAYKITLTYQSDELIKITIPNEKLGDYFRVLEKYESIIDEITNPRYIFGDENHKKINAKWLITKSKSDLIERELKERDIDFTLVSQVATTKHKRNSRQKRDVNNEDSAKIRTKEDCISRYYCLDQVYEWMRYITQKYPKIAEIVEVGESFHNRKLLALKLGYPNNEANKPLFWFDSAVHAREWTTINSVMFTIMNILEELNKSDSLMAKFLNRYDIYFLVVGNPDGYEYSYKVNNMWRKNMRDYSPHQKCFGVDLNRNFELFSKTGGKSSPCASDYKGTEPGSEPETHAIQKFILDRAPRWLSFISIHAFGAFWILNREEENFPNKNEFINHCEKALFSLKRIKQLNNKDFKFGTPKSLLGYSVSGATDTWAQMRAGAKYAFSIEIGPSESENDILIDGLGFHIDEDNIKQVAKTIYDGLYTYLSTFIDSIPYNERSEIRTFCSNEYENIKKNS